MGQDISRFSELGEEIIQVIPVGIHLLDTNFRICLWNPAMEKMTQIPASQALGKAAFEIFPHTFTTRMQEICTSVLREGKPVFRNETPQFMISGSSVQYSLSIFPLRNQAGLIDFLLICLEEMPDYKSRENELEKDAGRQAREMEIWEKNFYALVEGSLEGIGISTGETITYVNPSLARILGYKNPKELIGQSLMALSTPEAWEIIQERITRRRQGKPNPPRFEIKAQRKDGAVIDLEISTSHVLVDGTWVTLATIRDISEKKKIEDQERKIHEHILHSDRLAAMGRLSAGIAHEINNPLAVLSGRIQDLLTKYEAHEELGHNFASMKRVCDRIGKIVDSLLFFSRQKEEPRYLYEIHEVIEDAISMFEAETVTRGVRLIKQYAHNIPPVIVVASQIQQVCVNLLINAIDATKLGDEITISTKLDTARENVMIIFKDTGGGIPKKYLSKIFEPFFTTKEVGRGSGLGLSISAGIIKAHRGSIRVRSKEGLGTIFTIKLPLPTPEDLQQCGMNPASNQRSPRGSQGSGSRY
ncbi:MAG: PAS domain S-box protein [bacterium]